MPTPVPYQRSLIGMIACIVALHVIGWFTLIAIVVPQHLSVGSKVFGIGIGLAAYTLGMRHAFDADHIAAIDNVTRKLIREGRQSLTVGFWFSLGHSSVVFALTFLLACGVRALAASLLDNGSALHTVTGLIGATVSSGFLYAIAAVNAVVLVGIWKVFQRMRGGQFEAAALEQMLDNRGFITRVLRPLMRSVSEPWHMFLVGFLFGFGFDTATEIALLVLTGTGAASGLPWYALLCLPILFAAGMSLLDTIDGSFMNFAYGWALVRPLRKIYYNLIITALSVVVALIIGTLEIIGLFSDALHLHGAVWDWATNIDLNSVGFIIVGMFVAIWTIAVVVWKYGRIEEKWATARDASREL
jgi:high-affinity nickel-transport protein